MTDTSDPHVVHQPRGKDPCAAPRPQGADFGRRRTGRWAYAIVALMGGLCANQAVLVGIEAVGVPFGGGSAILLLTIFTVCGAALIAWTAAMGDNYAALLGIAVWPIVTFWWMHLGLQLPGTYNPGTWEWGGPKHTMGTDGGLLVFWSVTSLLAAVWFLGESRVPWWVRLPVSVAVIAANVTVVAMVSGTSVSG